MGSTLGSAGARWRGMLGLWAAACCRLALPTKRADSRIRRAYLLTIKPAVMVHVGCMPYYDPRTGWEVETAALRRPFVCMTWWRPEAWSPAQAATSTTAS